MKEQIQEAIVKWFESLEREFVIIRDNRDSIKLDLEFDASELAEYVADRLASNETAR